MLSAHFDYSIVFFKKYIFFHLFHSQVSQSPLESPSPRLNPWQAESQSPSILSADDSSEPVKRLCDNISKERDEQILPIEPHLCEGPIKSTAKHGES